MTTGAPLLQIEDAVKIYRSSGSKRDPVTALNHVSLQIDASPAKIVALAGESGSGKTTLGDAILGFTNLTSGRVLYQGHDISGFDRRAMLNYRRNVQAVFQDPFGSFNPFYRVRHVLDTLIRQFRLAKNREHGRELATAALRDVGLQAADTLDKYPHELSGGQRQRIMFARAYLLKPRLIVADEPVSMVDASLRSVILSIMIRLRDEEGISFLYITHDLSTAYQVCDDIHILYKGEVVESGSAQAVIDHPSHDYSKLLVSSIPLPDPNRRWQDATLPFQ